LHTGNTPPSKYKAHPVFSGGLFILLAVEAGIEVVFSGEPGREAQAQLQEAFRRDARRCPSGFGLRAKTGLIPPPRLIS